MQAFLPTQPLPPSYNLPARRKCFTARSQPRVSACIAAAAAAAGCVSSKEIMEMDAKVFVGTYARAPLVLASGKGCKLYDVEGREYLDMTAGIAVNALGHGDPEWVRAVTEQAGVLTHVSNIFYSKFPVKEISLSYWLIPQYALLLGWMLLFIFVYN